MYAASVPSPHAATPSWPASTSPVSTPESQDSTGTPPQMDGRKRSRSTTCLPVSSASCFSQFSPSLPLWTQAKGASPSVLTSRSSVPSVSSPPATVSLRTYIQTDWSMPCPSAHRLRLCPPRQRHPPRRPERRVVRQQLAPVPVHQAPVRLHRPPPRQPAARQGCGRQHRQPGLVPDRDLPRAAAVGERPDHGDRVELRGRCEERELC